jgi:hypothetical protein
MELDLPAPISLLLRECAHAAAQCTDTKSTFAKTKKSAVLIKSLFIWETKIIDLV